MAVVQNTGPGVLAVGRPISTEFSITLFQLATGVFGGIASLLAARRLEGAPDQVPIGALVLPIAVAGASTVIGAMLLPSA